MEGITEYQKNQIKNIVEEQTEIYSIAIHDHWYLMSDLGIDTITKIKIAKQMEKLFEIEIPAQKIMNCRTVGDLYNLL